MNVSALPTGEPLPLDLVNTRPLSGGSRADLLGTPDRLAAWLARQRDRLGGETDRLAGETVGPAPSEADLAPVHAVRAHTEAALRALLDGRRPPESALRGLADAQRAAPAVLVPVWDGTAVTAPPRRTGPLGVRLAALLAEAAAALLADPAVARVKECEADDCVLLFLPAHPRRRWCSPARCGNRTRVARHYRRHRSS
ncbi:CGNR zinc finger domain-containing protein [Streptomyces sp.]|uniref:CGNR zinc finger domain-containing protein n=1 Tax=Streptomyces sp. TaxID=1931 RepID=UPI002D2947D4|nr:CGNR zinc finger domain-containing protein [Streptomyces sp.]HZF92550.1 CGNR zinc finger domain-containing protein [Streptomyces sp.]